MNEPNPAFEAWRDSMGREPWAKFDLSAARLGWDAATAALANASAPAEMHELSPFGHEYGEGPKLAHMMAAVHAQVDVDAPAETGPALAYQAAEEAICNCGAAGSGEGHSSFCPWLSSQWKRWGDAINSVPNPSSSDGEVSDEMVFAAMVKADELGEPLDDIDAREILTAALQSSKPVQADAALVTDALIASLEMANIMEGMTGCRGDDDWIWRVQAKLQKALALQASKRGQP